MELSKIHGAVIAVYHLSRVLVLLFHSVLRIVEISSPKRISRFYRGQSQKDNSHYHQLDVILFDLLHDLIETLAAHRTSAIGH